MTLVNGTMGTVVHLIKSEGKIMTAFTYCPDCLNQIIDGATRCPHCTSRIKYVKRSVRNGIGGFFAYLLLGWIVGALLGVFFGKQGQGAWFIWGFALGLVAGFIGFFSETEERDPVASSLDPVKIVKTGETTREVSREAPPDKDLAWWQTTEIEKRAREKEKKLK